VSREHVVSGSARTAAELAAALNVTTGTAQSVLQDFARRGIVEAVEPGRFALTLRGREVAGGFVAAGEEGFRGTD